MHLHHDRFHCLLRQQVQYHAFYDQYGVHTLLKHMALQQRLLIHVQYHIAHPANVQLREYTQHMT